MIPTGTLPLLQPLQFLPVVGQPLYDLLEPDMRILVNLGYGDIEHGWDQGFAGVPTPFALFPDVNPAELFGALADRSRRGFQNFIDDLASLSPQNIAEQLDHTADTLPSLTDIVDNFSNVLAAGYATLLPTADIINALITSLPVYGVSLFTQELAAGNLLDAIGLRLRPTSVWAPWLWGLR